MANETQFYMHEALHGICYGTFKNNHYPSLSSSYKFVGFWQNIDSNLATKSAVVTGDACV